MKTKQDFPLVLRRDSIAVKIYRADSRGFAEFTLAYRQHGKRIRRSYTDLKQARQEAERVLTKLSQGAFDVLTLPRLAHFAETRQTRLPHHSP